MSNSITAVSLRRSLRKITAFNSYTSKELGAIATQFICKEYKAGDIICHTSVQIDFIGIVQMGEIIFEYQINGNTIRASQLTAGDFLLPKELNNQKKTSSVLIHAKTDVRLYVLPIEKIIQIVRYRESSQSLFVKKHWLRHGIWISIACLMFFLIGLQDINNTLSGIFYLSANKAMTSDDNYQKSLKLLSYIRYFDKNSDLVKNHEGYIWFQQNNLSQAEITLQDAMSGSFPESASNNLAVIFFNTGRLQEAIRHQKIVVQNEPNNAIARYNLGVYFLAEKDTMSALREFKDASYIEPNWLLPYLQQWTIYLDIQDYINAERVARIAIEIDTEKQSAHLILSIALYNQNRFQESRKYIQNAIKLAPNDNTTRFYEALILSKLEEFDLALYKFKKLLRDCDNPECSSRIQTEIEILQRLNKFPADLR